MNKIQFFVQRLLVLILPNEYSRKKWGKHLKRNSYSNEDYRVNVKKIKENIDFFNIYPYCPDFSSDFDKEKPFLEAALAFANYCYVYEGRIDIYKDNVEKIGDYFEEQLTGQGVNNVQVGGIIQRGNYIERFDIYSNYLHARATIAACLECNPSMAAKLNNRASILSRNKRNIDDCVVYQNCSLCNKIESLVQCDHGLIDSLMKSAENIEKQLIELNIDSKHRERLFENYILRCKAQLYAIDNIEEGIDSKIIKNIEENLEKAKRIILFNDIKNEEDQNIDDNQNYMTIYLYSSFLSFFKGEVEEAKKYYDQAFEKSNNAKITYYCLIRIPEEHIINLAGSLEKPTIHYSINSTKRNDVLNNNFRRRAFIWAGLVGVFYLIGILGIFFNDTNGIDIFKLILGVFFLSIFFLIGKAIFHVYVERRDISYLNQSNKYLALKMIDILHHLTIALISLIMTGLFTTVVIEAIRKSLSL